ncbi:MAG: PAS domain S-box protein [Nitrospinota bacterium]|nr:PAS domain S-box protein [Nitrospinota bacterium]
MTEEPLRNEDGSPKAPGRPEERWKSLVSAATDIILIVDHEGKILFINHPQPGDHPDRALGNNFATYCVDRDHRQDMMTLFGDVIKTGQPAILDLMGVSGSKEQKNWYSSRVTPVKLDDGKPGAIIVFRDITELKSARGEMDRFFNLTPEPMCIASPTGYFQKVNPAFERILGFSREELVSRPFWEFIHPDDRKPTMREVEKQLQGGATLNFSNRYITRNGEERWFSWRAVQDFESGLLYAAAEDITERKLAHDQLISSHSMLEQRVSERTAKLEEALSALKMEMAARVKSEDLVRVGAARYRALIDAVMDGFVLLDDNGLILDINETYLKMTGYERDDLVGRRIADVDAAQSPSEIAQHMQDILTDGSTRFETRHRKKDGKTVDVEISASHEMIEGGFFIGLVRDITERRMLQHTQKLEAVGHLAGGMAHEFNNVLQGILGFATLLQSRITEGSTEEEYLERVITGTRRGADLVRRILSFSHKGNLQKTIVKIPQVLEEVTTMLSGTMPATVELRHQYHGSISPIMADHTQVLQVLLNLSINGAHAMDDAGILTIDAVDCRQGAKDPYGDDEAGCGQCPFRQRKSRRSCVAVGDTGPGVDPAIQERIYEPFFTTKQPGVGTGLGLSVASDIVRENFGHIFFHSQKGKGTRFYVSFPVIPIPQLLQSQGDVEDTRGRGERILLVDDEEMITSMAKIYLEEAGYRVDAFNSHHEALDLFSSNPESFHLLVTDQTMRGTTGVELAEKIQAIRPHIPIILITGYSRKLTNQSAARAGIVRILEKPILPHTLSSAIRQELDKKTDPS